MHIQEPDFSDMIRKSDSARRKAILDKAFDTTKLIKKQKLNQTTKVVAKVKPNKNPIVAVKKAPKKVSKKTIKKPEIVVAKKVPVDTSGLIYTVQIAALDAEDKKYSSINNVITYNENSLVKYSLGAFKTFKEANRYRKQINKKYKGAFVKALKNNVPIQLNH